MLLRGSGGGIATDSRSLGQNCKGDCYVAGKDDQAQGDAAL